MGSVFFKLSIQKLLYIGFKPGEIIRRYRNKIFPPVESLLLGKIISKY